MMNVLDVYITNVNKQMIDELFQKYQDIKNVDKISQIKDELSQTIKLCSESIDKLCIREDELNDLIAKSDELSKQSKSFLIEADKLNNCCVLF